MLDPFTLPYVQRGVVELLLLAGGAGVLGTWIVLRGLAFYAHGVAAATFPGLVLAAGVGFAAPLGALAAALLFGAVVRLGPRGERDDHGPLTAMVLVGALAVGVILASDVYPAATSVDSLLFGSLLVLSDRDLAIAAAATLAVLAATWTLGPRWLAIGFDRPGARAFGVRAGAPDAVLLLLVAVVSVAALAALGSLLAAAVMVIPAATMRPWFSRMVPWQIATVCLTLAEGVAGLWLSARSDAPPGATIAVLAGMTFAVSVITRSLAARRSSGPLRRRAPAFAAAGVAGIVLAVGIAGEAGSAFPDDGRVRVVATTAQVADLVREVGGDAVHVHVLLRAGGDPHEYEPRPSDVNATADADVVLASGLGLDDWVRDVRERSGSDVPLTALGDVVPTILDADGEHAHAGEDARGRGHAHPGGHDRRDGRTSAERQGDHAEHAHGDEEVRGDGRGDRGHAHADDHDHRDGRASDDERRHAHDHAHEHEHAPDDGPDADDRHDDAGHAPHGGHDHDGHDHGEHDPHWWHDPTNVAHATEVVRDALVAAAPGRRPGIDARAAGYRRALLSLDGTIERCLARIPAEGRKLVTSHHAFGYFAHRYDLELVGAAIPSQTTQARASAGDVDRLTRLIRSADVRAIFPESTLNRRLADAIAKETGASAEHTLYGDGLGEPGSDGDTYLKMLRHNADAVLRGLTATNRPCSSTP